MPIHQSRGHVDVDVAALVAQQVEEWAVKFQNHYDEKLTIVNKEQKETLAIVNRLGKYVSNLEQRVNSITSNVKSLRDENGEIDFPPTNGSNDFHSPVKSNHDLVSRINMLENYCGYDPEREAYAALGLGTGDLLLPEHKLTNRLDKLESTLTKLDRNVRHVETEVNIIAQEKSNNVANGNGNGDMITNGMFYPEKPRPKSNQGMRSHYNRDSTPGPHVRPSYEQGHNGYTTPHPPAHNGSFGYRSAPTQKSRNVSHVRPTSAPNANGNANANRGQMMQKVLEEVRNQISEVDNKNNMQNTFLMNEVMDNLNVQEEKTDRKLRSVEGKLKHQIKEAEENMNRTVSDIDKSIRSKIMNLESSLVQMQRQETFNDSRVHHDNSDEKINKKLEFERMLEEKESQYYSQQQNFHKKELELQRELQLKEEELRNVLSQNSETQDAYNRIKNEAIRLEEENNRIKEEHTRHIAQLEEEFTQRRLLVDERTELYKAETQRLREVHQEMQKQVNLEILQRTEKLESEKDRLEKKLTEEMSLHNRQTEKDRMIQDSLQSEIEMFKKSCNQAHQDKEQILLKLKAAEAKYADLETRLKTSTPSAKVASPRTKADVSPSKRPPNVQVPSFNEKDVGEVEEEDTFSYDTPLTKVNAGDRNQPKKKRVDTPIPQPQPRGNFEEPPQKVEAPPQFFLSPDTAVKQQSSKDLRKQKSSEIKKQESREPKGQVSRELKSGSSRELKNQGSRELKKQESRDLKKQGSRELRKQNSTASRGKPARENAEDVSNQLVGVSDVDDDKLQEMVQNKLSQNDIDDIIVLEELIKEKEAEIEEVSAAKSRAKKKIKVWMADFERANNRQPNQNEKEGVAELYLNHQKLSDLRQDHIDTLEKMKATLNQKVTKVVS
jgi:hypothetical protein